MTENETDTRGPPSWDGEAGTFEAYEKEARWFMEGQNTRNLYLWAETGWLNRQDGGAVLLAYLKKKFDKQAVPDLGKHLDICLQRLRRQKGDSMDS